MPLTHPPETFSKSRGGGNGLGKEEEARDSPYAYGPELVGNYKRSISK